MEQRCKVKWLIPICSNIIVFSFLVITIMLDSILFTIGIFSISRQLMISFLVLLASIAVTFALTLYSAISYLYPSNITNEKQATLLNYHKKFLFVVYLLFLIVMVAISFCGYSFRTDVFEFTDYLFNEYYNSTSKASEKFVKYVENFFKCKFFDSKSPSGNCAQFVSEFVNNKFKMLSIGLGSISVVFLILLIAGLCMDSKSNSSKKPSNDRSETDKFDINQELNPDVNVGF